MSCNCRKEFDLGVMKLNDVAITPEYKTTESACMDVNACFHSDTVAVWTDMSKSKVTFINPDEDIVPAIEERYLVIQPGERASVPTGLVLMIPHGYAVKLHPRSGLALKGGVNLINCEGVIDSDYPNELFVALHNTNRRTAVKIINGDAIAQIELQEVKRMVTSSVVQDDIDEHLKHANRTGGFGSTTKTTKEEV